MIAPHTHKPDRLSPQPKQRSPPQPNTRSHISHIKQRSPQQPTNPIANSSNQTAIAPQHPTPDRLFPSSNSDRPSQPINLIAYFPIRQRSPHTTHKTRSPIPHNKQRSPLTHKTRSPKSQHQTAIAPTTPNTRSPIPSNQTAISSHHPTPDRLFSKPNSDRLSSTITRDHISTLTESKRDRNQNYAALTTFHLFDFVPMI
ncbi:MAG: hypothetical protein ACK6AZ_10940 [Pseudanabaena sp.]